MAALTFSQAALADLASIDRYTAHRWGVGQASIYSRRISACCTRLMAHPQLGRSCEDIGKGLRRIEVGSHVLFYRPDAAGVRVFRILHKSMEPVSKRLAVS